MGNGPIWRAYFDKGLVKNHQLDNYPWMDPMGSGIFQGAIECTPNSVPMVFIVFSSDSWGL